MWRGLASKLGSRGGVLSIVDSPHTLLEGEYGVSPQNLSLAGRGGDEEAGEW